VGRLSGIRTVLLDLDGTLYVGSQVVAGAPEAVRWLRAQGLTVRFTTNTDSIPPATLADRLARLGFPAAEDELVTPIAVAAQLLASTRAGAELVATQVNRIAVRDDGEHLDTGGWVRLLEYATGQTARVLGKPSPEFFTAPLDALGRGPDTALVVGDDPAADIGGGRAERRWAGRFPSAPWSAHRSARLPAPPRGRAGWVMAETTAAIQGTTDATTEILGAARIPKTSRSIGSIRSSATAT
jgi:ribonucleotide monophosphatase NagD (HAD superfamily)